MHSATPSQTPTLRATTIPTQRPTARPTTTPPPPSAVLAVPMNTPLMPPPPGQPDEPLLGLTALAVSPGGKLAAGTYGNGVMISEDGGASWRFHRAGLPAEGAVTAIVLAPDFDSGGEAALLFAEPHFAPGFAAAYRSRDGGATWEGYPGLSAPISEIVYSPAYASDGTVFAVQGEHSSGRLLRSTNRGASWSEVLPANGCLLNVALSPTFASDRTAFAPRCDHVVKSTDGGATWTDVPLESGDFARGSQEMRDLQVLPSEPVGNHLLAQTYGQGMPRLSTDGGRRWFMPYEPASVPFAYGVLQKVVAVPEGTDLYAFGRSHLYDTVSRLWRSTDGGQSWQEVAHTPTISCNGPLCPVLKAPGTRRLWVATQDGLFRSDDGGETWRFVHPGGSRMLVYPFPARSADGVGVAVNNRGGGRYVSHYLLLEDRGEGWRPVQTFEGLYLDRVIFPAPNYRQERLILVIGIDFSGQAWVMSLRPDEQPVLQKHEDIPPGSYAADMRVSYAEDYATSGRIDLWHGGSGALYRSTDQGRTWAHADPGEPGACLRLPVRGFGALWSANAEVRNRLLCAVEDERGYTGLVQPFEHGEMLRLFVEEEGVYDRIVYTLLPGDPAGAVLTYYYDPGGDPGPLPTPPPGLFAPDAALLRAWQGTPSCNPGPEPLSAFLGWATAPAHETRLARQYFEGGVMIWREDRDAIIVYSPPESGRYVPFSCPIRYEVFTEISER